MIPKAPSSVIAAYLFANTPAYLTRKLVADPYVSELKRQYRASELVAIVSEVARQHPKELRDIAVAYAAIVALATTPIEARQRAIGRRKFSRLPWASDVLELASHPAVSSRVTEVGLGTLGTIRNAGSVPRATSTSRLIVTPDWEGA